MADNDTYYYLAKEIAETFDYHINFRLEDLKEESNGELWSECGLYVHFNTQTNKIEVTTEYFNEFDSHSPAIIYSFINAFPNKCRTYAEYGKIVGEYFKYFQKDFPCYFSITARI